MRNVMTKAWEIARKGVEKFGGKAIEYISESLRIAWAIVKKGGNKMVEMKGSEKQIKWANDINPKEVEAIGEVLEDMGRGATKKLVRSLAFPVGVRFFMKRKKMDDAGFRIENFGYSELYHDFVDGFNRYVNKRKEESNLEKPVYHRIDRIMSEAGKRAMKQTELNILNN